MKIRAEHFERLTNLMKSSPLIARHNGFRELQQMYIDNKVGKDPQVRARWDCFWAIDRKQRDPLVKELYEYCNDTHIDTALKRITATMISEE